MLHRITQALSLSLSLAVSPSLAETIVRQTGQTNTIQVPENEVFIVSFFYQEYFPKGETPPRPSVKIRDQIHEIGYPHSSSTAEPTNAKMEPWCLAGPMELIIPTNFQYVIRFDRIKTAGIHTDVASNRLDIAVPSGKTLYFSGIQPPGFGNDMASVTQGTNVVAWQISGASPPPQRIELDGPATLTLLQNQSRPNPAWPKLVSYYFADALTAVPGAVTLDRGTAQLTIEKSTDLENWFPALFQTVHSDRTEFFRFNFQK